MTEENNQIQDQSSSEHEAQDDHRQQDNRQSRESSVPRERFDTVNERMQNAERRIQEMEQKEQQETEQRAQQQGEYQKLAESRKEQLDKRDARIKELETQIVTGERYRAFSRASQGIILPEALDDAFSMLTEDEFKSADPSDMNTYRVLADGLAERKPYLADGIRGSGSGGSSRPVLGTRSAVTDRRNQTRKGSPFGKATEKPPFR